MSVVSGKGGTGKTTVAASLALALAAGGRQVLLTEVEARQGIAQLFDTPPLPYEERRVAVARGGGEVYALAVDPELALLEYLETFYNLDELREARSASAVTGLPCVSECVGRFDHRPRRAETVCPVTAAPAIFGAARLWGGRILPAREVPAKSTRARSSTPLIEPDRFIE